MSEPQNTDGKLFNLGKQTYYEKLHNLLEEQFPDRSYSVSDVNTASVEAVLYAVSEMIRENN